MVKLLVIDFLYLDLEVCRRCQGTEHVLSMVLEELSEQLRADGYEITLNKVNVNSLALANKHHFVSSPTIRVNGRDLSNQLVESHCDDCGTLCGDSVDCRVWIYQGQPHTTPPIEMIREALMSSLDDPSRLVELPYDCPPNLKRYYEGLSQKKETYPSIHLKHL